MSIKRPETIRREFAIQKAQLTTAAPTDVYHYFREKLGRWPSEQVAKDVSILSRAGMACVCVIDATAHLIEVSSASLPARNYLRGIADDAVTRFLG